MSSPCTAPDCTTAAVALVRLSVQPLEGYADPVEGHTRFTVCDEHLAALERSAERLADRAPLVTLRVERFA